MNLENYEMLPVEAQDVQIVQVDAVERANVDSQVATAKQYPRSIKRSIDNSIVIATMMLKQRRVADMPYPVEENRLLAHQFTLPKSLFPTGGI